MVPHSTEETIVHTRLMKCALEVEDARSYWSHINPDGPGASAQVAFEQFWFGSRSLPAVDVLLANFRARFDAIPEALRVLHRWTDMEPATRRLICHFHLQFADPLYRAFTGDWLVGRRQGLRPDVTRDLVVRWVADQGPGRWTAASRIQIASKLLSAAFAAGLVGTNRDPRPLTYPRVDDAALGYLLHLLRGVEFSGTILVNPYLASVGLTGGALEERLRSLPSLAFGRQGDLVDFGWHYRSLAEWAAASIHSLAQPGIGAEL
jgi:hypothetical protein